MIGSRSTATALLIATFAVGGLTGAGLMNYYDRQNPPPRPPTGPTYYLARLTRELGLNETQQERVKLTLNHYSPLMDSLSAEIRPRYETLRQSMRTEIRATLTDDQRTKYEEMLRRHDAERSNAAGARARP